MSSPNIGALRAVADRLDALGFSYAFVGGAIVNLLFDDPSFSPARPTEDVDVILEVVTAQRYSDVEAQIRGLGFSHDMSEGAPLCRWSLGSLTVDIMPTEGRHLGLNTDWFSDVLATATEQVFSHTKLKLVSPVGFLVTKYVAFLDRGRGDMYASHDLEDFVAVIDGREAIVVEIDRAPERIRRYMIEAVRSLLSATNFVGALPGYIASDTAGQGRLPGLINKLQGIAALR